MKEYITLDAHKHYTFAAREEVETRRVRRARIAHAPGCIRHYLRDAERGTTVAVEATGNWYWIVDEIEAAGCRPALVHPRKAKVMLGCINKTDKLDADGMNRLQRVGTLPTVWIAPASVRDLRELPRTRMFLCRQRAALKNRIQANASKHGLGPCGYSDPLGKVARRQLREWLPRLPGQTAQVTGELLDELDGLDGRIAEQERRLGRLVAQTPEMVLLQSLPGIGPILSTVIALEIGEVRRFPSAEHLASYSGTTPRVHSSGDRIRFGRLRPDVNRYLKWAFIEAANCTCIHRRRHPQRHVSILYGRIAARKGHAKAIGAVARHLAEAAYHVLSKNQNYKDPANRPQACDQGGVSATTA